MSDRKRMPNRYTIYALSIAALFAVFEWRGVNLLPTTEHTRLPASVRSSPGGYRSYQYHWSRGYHGGK